MVRKSNQSNSPIATTSRGIISTAYNRTGTNRTVNSTSSSSNTSNNFGKISTTTIGNADTAENLKYCTSTSSISSIGDSPYTKHKSCFKKRTKLKRYSSTSSSSSRSSISSAGSPSLNVTSSHLPDSQHNSRKRKATLSLDDKDPEIGCELPLAKRQQYLTGAISTAAVSVVAAESTTTTTTTTGGSGAHYSGSESDSVVSSVYPSPVDMYNDMLCTRSSSSVHSAIDVAMFEELPDSPASPLPDSPDSPPSPDRGNAMQQHVVVRYIESGAVTEDDHGDDDDDHDNNDNDDDGNVFIEYGYEVPAVAGEDDDNEDDHTIVYQQCGERTPGAQLNTHNHNNNNNNNKIMSTVKNYDKYMADDYKCLTPAVETVETQRSCPLPALSWAIASDVWKRMCKKDEDASYLRNVHMLDKHPGLQPRMRAILLDWLIEVCEVYKLHRETYYLAVDYLDRYLNEAKRVQKTHLQLIGITCLFVAAKVEEIYPPKIGEFAYVTDGACTEDEILQYEKLLLNAINWQINPITIVGWLGVYMQLNVDNRTPLSLNSRPKKPIKPKKDSDEKTVTTLADQADDAFIYPQFSGMEFAQTAQLLDLCSLDVGITNFSYSVIAAAAMSFTFNPETALRCSGLDWQQIEPCARWMEPFFEVISEEAMHLHLAEQNEQVTNKFGLGHICPNIVTDDSHIIQTHTITMEMFDRVLSRQHQITVEKIKKQEASPATGLICPEGLLTPPASSRKPLESVDSEAYYQDDGTRTQTVPSCQVSSSTDRSHENRENRENIATVVYGSSSHKRKSQTPLLPPHE